MQQTADKPVEMSYENLIERYVKFHANVSPTDVEGINHLSIEIELPYRNRREVGEWMRAFVNRLESDPGLEVDAESIGKN